MPISVPQIAALLTRRASDDLLTLLENVPDEYLHAKVSPSTRTIVELVEECALVNFNGALLLTNRGRTVGSEEFPDLLAFVNGLRNTRESCKQALSESTTVLVDAIHGVSEAATSERININRFQPEQTTIAEACLYPYWNMVYHEGQINFIQLLYGDDNHYHQYHKE